MRAAVLEGVKKISVRTDYPKPEPRDDEILIHVEACGLCGTDLKLYKGEYSGNLPMVIGHEYAGTVEKVGKNVQNIRVGDRVVADPNEACGACDFCRSAQSTFCTSMAAYGVLSDGGFAEYCVAREKGAYRIPGNLKAEVAAFTEPVSCGVHAVDQAAIRAGQTVAILGAGPMGQIILQMVKNTGATKVIVIGRSDWKLELAGQYGATDVVNSTRENVEQRVMELTGGLGADVVIEAVGTPETFEQTFRLAARGGRIVLFGFCAEGREAKVIPFNILSRELTLVGSWVNPYTYPRAIRLLASGKVEVEHLISRRLAIEEVDAGLQTMLERPAGFMKAVIFPEKRGADK